MITVCKEIEVEVDVGDLGTEELIEAVEELGFVVYDKDDCGNPENIRDDIYSLYRDFVQWDKNEIPDNGFVLSLKKFFSEHLDKNVL